MSPVRFFDDAGMDFAARCVLSGTRHGMAEVGEVLAAFERVRDGDPESWLETFVALGRELGVTARQAAERGNGYSAWNGALRSSNYLFAGYWWAPATTWSDKSSELWEEHRSSWDLAVEHWPSSAWPVRLPHRSTTLPGVWFRSPVAGDEPSAAIIMIQGLGTPISDSPMTGLDGALARGHHVLVVDGPGQGAALHRQGLTLGDGHDDEWSEVVESLIDWLSTRPEVDTSNIVLSGIGHGSLFAALAAARSERLAALVVDPGATNLGTDARAALRSAETDVDITLLAATTTQPTGTADLDRALARLDTWAIRTEQIASISCPTFVGQGEQGGSFCGQTDELTSALTCEFDHVRFTTAEGAGADSGIGASQIHDAAVYDWLDHHLSNGSDR